MGASQGQQILDYLKQGHTLTPLDALIKFHCMRLAARINELRAAGYRIATGEKLLSSGKRVAEYRLEREEECSKHS